jgi:hypothetical protein
MYPAETAFCWTEVYLDWRPAPIVRPIDVLRTAVFVMVEDQVGEPIVELRQDVHPGVIDAAKGADPRLQGGRSRTPDHTVRADASS